MSPQIQGDLPRVSETLIGTRYDHVRVKLLYGYGGREGTEVRSKTSTLKGHNMLLFLECTM